MFSRLSQTTIKNCALLALTLTKYYILMLKAHLRFFKGRSANSGCLKIESKEDPLRRQLVKSVKNGERASNILISTFHKITFYNLQIHNLVFSPHIILSNISFFLYEKH